jgi:hypothetical protein
LPQGASVASVASFGVLIFGSFMWWNTFTFLDLQKYEVRLSQKSCYLLRPRGCRTVVDRIPWASLDQKMYKFIKNSHFHICSHFSHFSGRYAVTLSLWEQPLVYSWTLRLERRRKSFHCGILEMIYKYMCI